MHGFGKPPTMSAKLEPASHQQLLETTCDVHGQGPYFLRLQAFTSNIKGCLGYLVVVKTLN